MHMKRWLIPTVVIAFVAAAVLGPTAAAQTGVPSGHDDDPYYHHTLQKQQHGGPGGHLPPVQENVDLVAKLKLTNSADDVSDVSALQAPNGKWYAYVGDWGAKCASGGVNVVDVSNPGRS